jgi:RND superfamily putative drug exporter
MREGAPDSPTLGRWTRLVVRFRWVVIAIWIAIFVVAQILSAGLSDLWRSEAGLPGTDAHRAEDILSDHFGQRSYASFTLVARAEEGDARTLLTPVQAAAARAAEQLPTGQFVGAQPISDDVVIATITTELDVPKAHDYTEAMREEIGAIPGAETWLTGTPALQTDLEPVIERDLLVGELFIAVPIAVLVLVFIFGTLSFLLPLIFALVAIPTTLAFVWVFAHWLGMEQTIQQLVTFVGLGIAIDYSLFLVYRFRDELKAGRSREDAVVRTMQTAGRSVVFAGTTVAIGLALLILVPVPGIRGYGVAGLLIPLVSVACALTLMPALLYSVEPKLDRVRLVPKRILERRDSRRDEDNGWLRLAHAIMRRPLPFFVGSLVFLLLCAAPVFALRIGPGTNEKLPENLEATQGLRIMSAAIGAGALSPTVIVVDSGGAGGVDQPAVQGSIGRLILELGNDPEVGLRRFAAGPGWVDPSRRYARIEVVGRSDPGVEESERFIDRARSEIVPSAEFPDGTTVYVGGGPAFNVDFIDKTYSAFPWLVAAVLGLTYVLLLRAFRSVILPAKAILLNLLSVAAAFGLLVAAFRWGLGEPFGLIEYDQITGWIPVFLFAVLFGLSMDYEVFLVSRMREEWDATGDNREAVAQGLAKTGRLVTAAGVIMFAAFMGLVAGSFVDLQQFGFGLAIAILVDVTVIRVLLLPSAMALMGRWNWWLPSKVAKVARVDASPLEPRAAMTREASAN